MISQLCISRRTSSVAMMSLRTPIKTPPLCKVLSYDVTLAWKILSKKVLWNPVWIRTPERCQALCKSMSNRNSAFLVELLIPLQFSE